MTNHKKLLYTCINIFLFCFILNNAFTQNIIETSKSDSSVKEEQRRDLLIGKLTRKNLIRSQRELSAIKYSTDSNGNIHIYTDSLLLKKIIRHDRDRILLIGGLNISAYGSSLIALSNTWYKNYPHSSFHTFNDDGEWLQVDKFGHAWTAYSSGRVSSALWKWAGLSDKKAIWIGGLSGTLYLTVIEFLDGHSSEWGWSWGDMTANVFGSSLFISQQLGWHEQRIQYKFSFHKKNYGEPDLEQRSNDLFGKSWYERMLKDYNAQTYWFSFNLKSFFKQSNLPDWLNVSLGYGADGMFGGFDNIAKDANGNIIFDRTDIPRKRQFYLSPDIDFTKIKTKSKLLRTLFVGLNAFKCPAPALMMDSKGKLKGYVLYF